MPASGSYFPLVVQLDRSQANSFAHCFRQWDLDRKLCVSDQGGYKKKKKKNFFLVCIYLRFSGMYWDSSSKNIWDVVFLGNILKKHSILIYTYPIFRK